MVALNMGTFVICLALAFLAGVVVKNYYIEKIKVCNMLIRKEIIPIDEVYSAVKDVLFEPNRKKSFVNIRGDLIKGNSQRFQTFFTKGLKCVSCGIEGKYFARKNKGR